MLALHKKNKQESCCSGLKVANGEVERPLERSLSGGTHRVEVSKGMMEFTLNKTGNMLVRSLLNLQGWNVLKLEYLSNNKY